MTVRAKLEKTSVLPLGEYGAILESVDDGPETQHGPTWLWSFRIAEGEYQGTEIGAISSVTYSTYPSKSYRWANALGHPSDCDFNGDLVIGKPCRLKVDVTTREDGVKRNKILDVLAATKAQQLADELRFGK